MKHRKTILRVLRYLKPYRIWMGLSLICALLTVGAQLLIPVFTGLAIDGMIGPGQVDFRAVSRMAWAVAAAAAMGAVSQYILAVSNQHIAYSTGRDLRLSLNGKFHTLPLSYLDGHPAGDLLSRMLGDVDSFSEGLLMGFTQLFTGVLSILGTLEIMLCLNVGVTLAVVVLTPLSFFAAGFITKHTRKYLQQQTVLRGRQSALMQELAEGQKTLRIYGRQAQAMAEFDAVNEELEKASLLGTFFSSLTNPSTRMVNNCVYGAVALVSGMLALGGGVSVGQVSVFLSYASQYGKPFNEISGVVMELQNALCCAERVFEVLDAPDCSPEPDDREKPTCTGRVELEDICFSYDPAHPLMEDVALSVEPGQHVAIVGPTGCGKTTLINLLMRFYDPDGGKIRVDGRDIQSMSRRSLRGFYGMVLQDTWLCSGTVAENIAYGSPGASREQVEAAARAAFAHGFISRLPQGYDTVIRENGSNLSSGQRQLICIARVMLAQPVMLILDEATSSIDTRTEMKIQDAFHRMMIGRTSFVVAHRLSTIRQADRILVMEQGRIVEQGTHKELMERQGAYWRLYNSGFDPA